MRPEKVLARSDGFKVFRVYAKLFPAQMVDMKTHGNRSLSYFVSGAMSQHRPSIE
jgi:hypothetical protein